MYLRLKSSTVVHRNLALNLPLSSLHISQLAQIGRGLEQMGRTQFLK